MCPIERFHDAADAAGVQTDHDDDAVVIYCGSDHLNFIGGDDTNGVWRDPDHDNARVQLRRSDPESEAACSGDYQAFGYPATPAQGQTGTTCVLVLCQKAFDLSVEKADGSLQMLSPFQYHGDLLVLRPPNAPLKPVDRFAGLLSFKILHELMHAGDPKKC